MMSKGSSLSVDMCSLPEVVQFSYHEDQEMHSAITITNNAEHNVSYKVHLSSPRSKPTSQDYTSSSRWRDKSTPIVPPASVSKGRSSPLKISPCS